MRSTQSNRSAEILLLAPVDWDAEYNRLTTDQRYALELATALDAVQLARFSAYLSRRLAGGKHADAVKRQNQTARKVRQALGYTYAKDEISF